MPHVAHHDEDTPTSPPAPAGSASSAPAGTQALNILDAVCVIYFAASGQTKLLVDILAAAGYRIYVPQEVLEEVRSKASRKKWNITGLNAHLGTGPDARIVVIDKVTAAEPEAFSLLAQVRRRHSNASKAPASATFPATKSGVRHDDEDLGECVVITHAVLAGRRKLDVVVSIDDRKGQDLAATHNLAYFTVEDAISAGVEHEVLDTLGARHA